MKIIAPAKIENERNTLPVKMWADDIEEQATIQIKNLSSLPFAFHHIAIMPDCHSGYGMPIGGVLVTKNVVIPNAVGVDIGCGMCAVKTSLTSISHKDLEKIVVRIKQDIPVGFTHQKTPQDEFLMPDMPRGEIVSREYQSARSQLGTLGGGNHFQEIQKGSDGHIWIMLHSGSRNLGKQVADHYNKIAVEMSELWQSPVPKSWQLAFLPLESAEGEAYMHEMEYCVRFALANRRLMMERICGIIEGRTNCTFEPMINIAHNYAAMENHFGENVIVHRKGATLARESTIGIIPGSMGSKSYIVQGKGNPESFMSCSHGAGRKMSRTHAKKNLDLHYEKEKLDKQHIIHDMRSKDNLDEAPGAYKNIDKVMKNQEDLVDIVVELTPLAVVKG